MSTADQRRQFETRLRHLLQRVRWRTLAVGALRWLAVGGAMLVAAVWGLGAEHGPGVFNGTGLILSLVAGLLVLGWHLLLRPLRAVATPARLAVRIEREASFANLVVAAEEAGRCPERWPDDSPVAAELKRRLYTRAVGVLDLVDARSLVSIRYGRSAVALLAAAVLTGVLQAAVRPAEWSRGWARLVQPSLLTETRATGGLYADAGSSQVVVGEGLDLVGLDFAAGPGQAVAEVKRGTGTWQVVNAREAGPEAQAPGVPPLYRRWTARVLDVREDFEWRYRRGSLVSAPRRVEVLHHPLLTRLSAVVQPPAYTGLPARELEHLPSWSEVPAGSTIRLHGLVNHPVREAVLLVDGTDSVTMAVDSLQVQAALAVPIDRSFSIQLVDDHGLRAQRPLPYDLVAVPDLPPAVGLVRSEDDGILPISGELVLTASAVDDYGLAELRLLARAGADWQGGALWPATGDEQAWREVPTSAGMLRVRAVRTDPTGGLLRIVLTLEVRADGLDLVPGDVLELLVEAEDNKRPGPAGRGRSEVLRLVLPAAAEVLVAQAEANEERKSELEELRQRSRSLNADLDRLNRELMKNPLPDWARQQEMNAALERQRSLQEELARVAEQVRHELEKLAASQLTSEAQLRKAEEMGELLSPAAGESLSQLLQQMEESGGQASPQDMARAMDEVARNQQDMARRLDAALAMLKRMAQEQEMEGLTALLEQMIRKQQELADLSRHLEKQQLADARQAEEAGPESDHDATDRDQAPDPAGQESNAETEAGQEQSGQDQPGQDEQSQPSQGQDPADQSPPPSAEELARRQAALERELEQLREKLEQALENLRREAQAQQDQGRQSEANQEMAEALEKAVEQVQKQQQSGQMGKAGEQLQQMDPGEAAKMQEQALRDLGALYSVLLKSQQSMQQAMQMEQVGSLRGLAADLLALSDRQERIAQDIPPQLRDLRAQDLTRGQHRLQKAALGARAELAELMAEAPNRIMKLLGQLDGLIAVMGESVQAMEDDRAPVARRQARDSMAQANQIVIGLLTEAQMQSGSGGGSGSSQPAQSLSEQLQQMAQEQAGLNGVTDELRRMLADRGISQEARSRMERLGQQQAEMAGRMGELAEQERLQPEGDRLLGDLGAMGRDMERIGREIAGGLVDDDVLARQERILGRMLDARNSVRRRDYTNRRESQAADDLYGDQAGRLGRDPLGPGQAPQLRFKPLEQAPMEYRELVRRYFAAVDSLGRLDPAPGGPAAGGTP